MHHFKFIFIGFLSTFLTAWLGLAIIPSIHYGREQAGVAEIAPLLHGEAVYAANGCVYCHTQQVRSPHFGNDHKRNWGDRRSVAADYMGDRIAFLGTMRTGPDLANVGVRLPSADWHYQHLFDPESTTPDSVMPKYRYLFERKKAVNGQPDADAVALDAEGTRVDADGYQWVPGDDAKALVAYLLALKRTQTPRPEGETFPMRER